MTTQLDLFGAPPPVDYTPKPEKIRAELHAILAELQGAEICPWTSSDLGYYRTVFPQMANWLPVEEANRLRAEFEAELARLDIA